MKILSIKRFLFDFLYFYIAYEKLKSDMKKQCCSSKLTERHRLMRAVHFDKNARRYRALCRDVGADSRVYRRQLMPQLPRLQGNGRNRPGLEPLGIDPK